MATLKRRLHKNNGSGYDVVYFETLAELVKCNDGSTVESALANKSPLNHAHETRFYPYAANTANFCEEYSYDSGEMWFNYYGASKPISTYSLSNGMGSRLGYMIHSGNVQSYVLNSLGGQTINPVCLELSPSSGSTFGGYIDFHYGGSTVDYTSRIIESPQGRLVISAPNGVYVQDVDPGTYSARNIVASTSDPGSGSSLSTGAVFCLRIRRLHNDGSIEEKAA